MDERELCASCHGHFERPGAKRPDFWHRWQKNDNAFALSWQALPTALADLDVTTLSSPLEGASYRQGWRTTENHVTIR